jgi:hypothetical protein
VPLTNSRDISTTLLTNSGRITPPGQAHLFRERKLETNTII